MFKKFRFFKRFKKLVFGGFAIVFGAITCCLLGSWTIDNNGNLITDNVFNNDNIYAYNGFYNNNYVFTNNTSYNVYEVNVVPNTTYTFYYKSGYAYGSIIGLNTNQVLVSLREFQINTLYTFNTGDHIKVYLSINKSCADNGYIMIYEGDTYKEWEPYGIYYSETNYDTLHDNYTDLQQQYDDLINLRIDYNNYEVWLVNFDTAQTTSSYTNVVQVPSNTVINEYGFLDIDYILSNYSSYSYDGISVESSNFLNLYNYNLLFNGSGSPNIDFGIHYSYFDTDNLFLALPLNNAIGDTYYYGYFDLIGLLDKSNIDINPNNVLYNKFVIHYSNIPSANDLNNIKLNSSDGYNQGYAQGQREFFTKYEILQQNYNQINNELKTLQSNFDVLQQRYDELSNSDLGFSMSKLMWNIASTPFESFKSIWSVNFLDFNIASFITGILSIFVIVWLLKKIF